MESVGTTKTFTPKDDESGMAPSGEGLGNHFPASCTETEISNMHTKSQQLQKGSSKMDFGRPVFQRMGQRRAKGTALSWQCLGVTAS